MKNIVLIIGLAGLVSLRADAQTERKNIKTNTTKITTRTTTPPPATPRPVNTIDVRKYNYPANAPNTDNKELNKNVKQDRVDPDDNTNVSSYPQTNK